MKTAALFALGICLVLVFFLSCSPVPSITPEQGSHGYRTWQNEKLVSFTHTGGRVCIPYGWEPLGALTSGATWTTFEQNKTGVFIRTDAFASVPIALDALSSITLRFPKTTSPLELPTYEKMVTDAFTQVSELFPHTPRTHTVLITAGLGLSESEADSIYPDPNAQVSYLILKPAHDRSEELFIHALMHLYNHQDTGRVYAENQSPIPARDFKELEASWAETAFASSNAARRDRVDYLYNVHEAVHTRDFSRIIASPFTDEAGFTAITEGLALSKNATYLDEQYNHYILAPLVMLGIEGLLQKYQAPLSVRELLTQIHTSNENMFDRLRNHLPDAEFSRIMRWVNGTETVDRSLIELALTVYNR